jgi:hypothetical protein
MRFTLLLALLLGGVALGGDKKATGLTATEVAEGWLMLFDGESMFRWTVEGEAVVKDGELVLGGTKASVIKSSLPMTTGMLKAEYGSAGESTKLTFEIDPSIGVSPPVDRKTGLAITLHDHIISMSVPAGKSATIRSLCVQPNHMVSLFNGKDLTGWKVFPGAKDRKVASKFSVTKEGWLNVKDGPGDLQTEGQWADFIVQLECISNGKHLNSGWFFRCLADQYQQGYEAQIRNEWMGDDRTKPVDFGTGAIYRRKAARKVVSTDGEWFTLTVAARGAHISTWVNGYPVVDWSDDRKESENARQGLKKGKGAMSIQGHDPTTDLSFRRIRIQSLDSK